MNALPMALGALAVATLGVVLLDGRSLGAARRSAATARDRRTWWLLLLVALAGAAGEVSGDGGSNVWRAAAMGALAVALTRAVVTGLRRGASLAAGAGPWLLVALVGWLFTVNALHNHAAAGGVVLARGAALGFWLAFALYVKLADVSLRMVAKAVVVLMCVVAVAVALSDAPWRACDQFKCGIFGALLKGPFTSENTLAQLATVSLLLLLGVRGAAWRVPAFALSALMLSATSSRTSILAVGCAAAFWFLAGPAALGRSRRMLRAGYAGVVLGAHTVSAVLLVGAEQATLSNRGRIWTRAMEAIDGFTPVGFGVDHWITLQRAGVLPPLFPHNQLLLTYFSGGAVAVVILLALLLSPLRIRAGGDGGSRFLMAYGTYLSVLGIAEVYWNPLAIDIHLAVLAPFVALLVRRSGPPEPRSPSRTAARDLVAAGRVRAAGP